MEKSEILKLRKQGWIYGWKVFRVKKLHLKNESFAPAIIPKTTYIYYRSKISKREKGWGPFACFKTRRQADRFWVCNHINPGIVEKILYKPSKAKRLYFGKIFGCLFVAVRSKSYSTLPTGTQLANEFVIL